MTPRHLFLVILVLLLPLPAPAAGEEEITWEDCLREALRRQPELQAARESVEQARARVGQTRSGLLPQVRGAMSADRSGRDEDDTSYAYSVQGSQLFFDGLGSWYDTWASEQDLIAAQFDYATVSARIRYNLRLAFIELLQAQELKTITEEILRRRVQQAEMVSLRYEAGREHRGALLTGEANLAQARFDREQAGRDIRLARQKLSKEIGWSEYRLLTARGEFEPETALEPAPGMEELGELNPEILKLRADLEAARYGVKSSRADFSPSIAGSARIGRSDSSWPPGEESWSLGLSLSLPIFEGGRRIDELSRVNSALRQSEERLRSGRHDIRFSLEKAWKDYLDARQRVVIRNLFQEADRERSRIAEAQYSTGILSFDNWIIIEDNLVRSRKSLLESRAGALNAEASWLLAIGVTLEGYPDGQPPEF
ncbi:MAG: TolC family protein [Candidatus Erginobacter occultus]|nr:TolC family protein [Candidatus Erginobacter occultus]